MSFGSFNVLLISTRTPRAYFAIALVAAGMAERAQGGAIETVVINTTAADYNINTSPAQIRDNRTTNRVGSGGSTNGQINAFYVFPLPVLDGNTLAQASFSFPLIRIDGRPAYDIDLWGIGIEPSSAPLDEVYFGDATDDGFAGNVKLQDGILTPLDTAGGTYTTNAAGSAALLNYLQAFYDANPTYAGGEFAFLRINHDAFSPSTTGYTVAFFENGGTPAQLTISYSLESIPEPSTVLLLTIGMAGLLMRRGRRTTNANAMAVV